MNYINDYHLVLSFGKNRGKRLVDCDEDYLDWLRRESSKDRTGDSISSKPITAGMRSAINALKRIDCRRGVTCLVHETSFDLSFMPPLKIVREFEPVVRPANVDPRFFGTFIEMMLKYAKGLRSFDCANARLEAIGLQPTKRFASIVNRAICRPSKHDYHYKYNYDLLRSTMSKSPVDTITAIACISDESDNLCQYYENRPVLQANCEYLWNYINRVASQVPELSDAENLCNDQISVGCVNGKLDFIANNRVWEVKAAAEDAKTLDLWTKQLWAYAALHTLRYGSTFVGISLINLLTGRIYETPSMSISPMSIYVAKAYVRDLCNTIPEHVHLMDHGY